MPNFIMPTGFQTESPDKNHPRNLLPSLRAVEFVCPLCRGRLDVSDNGYGCGACRKTYVLHDGIPDFRVFPDPFLTFEEDYERTEIVLAGLEKFGLEKLLEYYWSFSDITPEDLRPKYVRSAMLGEQKAQPILNLIKENSAGKGSLAEKKVLEIGSGTGNFLILAAPQFKQVVGIDIGMRWLHVSRRRFMDKGVPVPPLVCCCAEFLPFADNYFDAAVAISTFEFVSDQQKVLAELSRSLNENGEVYLNSVNRFSIARDPYAYLWGVGFLPRFLQAKYVFWRRGASYENVKTLSYGEFGRMSREHFPEGRFTLPDVAPEILEQFSRFTQMQVRAYRSVKKLPVFSQMLKRFGPAWNIRLRKN